MHHGAGLGPEYRIVAGYGRAAVLGGSKRRQPYCLELPAITCYQLFDLRR